MAQLRKTAGGHREENVLEHRRPAASHQLQCQGQQRGSTETQRLRYSNGRTRLHRQTGTASFRMVPTGPQIAIKQLQASSDKLQENSRDRFRERESFHLQLEAYDLKLPGGVYELCDRPTSQWQEQEHGKPPAFPAALP
ncbi:hypothetical protein EMIT0215P_120177 [Pseudomonas serboccidentalis]